MPPICFICNENYIDYNSRCSTCKKSICKECYIKVIKNDNDDEISYCCPFCKCLNHKEILDLDKEIIYKFLTNDNIKLINQNRKLKKGNDILKEELGEEIDFLNRQINKLENVRDNLTYENNKLQKILLKINMDIGAPEETPKKKLSEYNIFFKNKSIELKAKYPNMSPQEKMKEIVKLWKENKKN